MAVKIRLKRFGNKNNAKWRVVAADTKMPRDGRFVEELGYYNPAPKDEEFVVKEDRLDYWVSVGAQVSPAVKSLLKRQKRKTAKA